MDYIIGSIVTFGFNWAPVGFATCNGAILQITQNQALFSLIGAAFGGNGTSTFGLPNLCGKVPAGMGQDSTGENFNVAQTFGAKTKTLGINEMPVHSHTITEKTAGQTVNFGTPSATNTATATVNASSAQADKNVPTANYWAKGWDAVAQTVTSCYAGAKTVTMASDAVAVNVTTQVTMTGQSFNASNLLAGNTGGSTAFSLAQPSLVLNHCICTQGIYPSRP